MAITPNEAKEALNKNIVKYEPLVNLVEKAIDYQILNTGILKFETQTSVFNEEGFEQLKLPAWESVVAKKVISNYKKAGWKIVKLEISKGSMHRLETNNDSQGLYGPRYQIKIIIDIKVELFATENVDFDE